MISPILMLSYSCSQKKIEKPNILFIAVDDLRPELGCYGNTAIITPNIDRLAKTGMLFSNAYCQQSLSNPSRASLLTGRRPDAIKVWDLSTHFRSAVPDAVTLPEFFKHQGYRVEGVGKIFHDTKEMEDPQSWSNPKKSPEGIGDYPDTTMQRLIGLKNKGIQLRKEGVPETRIPTPSAVSTMSVDEPDNKLRDGAVADLAIDFLEEINEPFFLAVGFYRPHLPFVAPKKYFDLYDPEKIPQATNSFLPKDCPNIAINTLDELRGCADLTGVPSPFEGSLPLEKRQQLKHGYYACVSYIDAQIGRLLNALESNGLSENTIVILWGDHGWKLGEHNSWGKMTNYEIDTRAPLIIRVPWMKKKNVKTDALVEFVDIYPSLCELTGFHVSENLEGISFTPLLKKPHLKWKSAVFSQYMRTTDNGSFMGYSIRTRQYRYVEWINMETKIVVGRELYDHHTDPEENINIAGLTENSSLVKMFSEKLAKGWKAALPERTSYRGAKEYTVDY